MTLAGGVHVHREAIHDEILKYTKRTGKQNTHTQPKNHAIIRSQKWMEQSSLCSLIQYKTNQVSVKSPFNSSDELLAKQWGKGCARSCVWINAHDISTLKCICVCVWVKRQHLIKRSVSLWRFEWCIYWYNYVFSSLIYAEFSGVKMLTELTWSMIDYMRIYSRNEVEDIRNNEMKQFNCLSHHVWCSRKYRICLIIGVLAALAESASTKRKWLKIVLYIDFHHKDGVAADKATQWLL
jgi:hypothetical protein